MNTCERHGRIRCGECAYIEQLEEEREKLIEGLRWYSNQELWTKYPWSQLLRDGGKRARDILAKYAIEGDKQI